MKPAARETAYEIVWLTRRLFRAMAAAAEDSLDASGLSAAERAVMEFLYPVGRLTVPEIAARYDVSRQHVQVTVNGLIEKGLLRAEPNPRHKRSPHMRLSARGRAAFDEIRDNETAVIDRVFRDLPPEQLSITRDTLKTLFERLK